MSELRTRLPDTMPLSGLSIGAVGSRVVVREGGSRWRADSGQYVLDFEGDPAEGSLSVIERQGTEATPSGAAEWFERGLALERTDRRRRARRVRARHRRRSGVRRRAHQSRTPAARNAALRECRARLPRRDQGVRPRSGAALQPGRAARRHAAHGRSRRRVRRRAGRAIPASPTATTTWRSRTKGSRGRRKRCATWRAIACCWGSARSDAMGCRRCAVARAPCGAREPEQRQCSSGRLK